MATKKTKKKTASKASKKTAAKKSSSRKSTSKKGSSKTKKSASKKPAKKAAAKKPAKKPAKKTTAKKTTAKKPSKKVPTKTAAKKAPAKKTSKKTSVKKPTKETPTKVPVSASEEKKPVKKPRRRTNQKKLNSIRLGLLAKKEDLTRHLQSELIGLTAADRHHLADLEEMASDTQDTDSVCEIMEVGANTLEQIELALAKIESNTYGLCEDCGDEIPIERLEALPFATVCVSCKRKQELARSPWTA